MKPLNLNIFLVLNKFVELQGIDTSNKIRGYI